MSDIIESIRFGLASLPFNGLTLIQCGTCPSLENIQFQRVYNKIE
jgi:hypothetical protein